MQAVFVLFGAQKTWLKPRQAPGDSGHAPSLEAGNAGLVSESAQIVRMASAQQPGPARGFVSPARAG